MALLKRIGNKRIFNPVQQQFFVTAAGLIVPTGLVTPVNLGTPATNRPTDVPMVPITQAELSLVPLNTPYSQLQLVNGGTIPGTGNLQWYLPRDKTYCRLLSDQAWRVGTAALALPPCPNGKDRVQTVEFGPDGSNNIVSQGKSLASITPPAGAATLYVGFWKLLSSNYYQNFAGSTKMFYFKSSTSGGSIVAVYRGGAGFTAQHANVNMEVIPAVNDVTSAVTYARNEWKFVELTSVRNTAGQSNAHFTFRVNGIIECQVSGFTWPGTSHNVAQQFLTYYGGGGTSSPPGGNGKQYEVTGDNYEIWYSTQRAALPV